MVTGLRWAALGAACLLALVILISPLRLAAQATPPSPAPDALPLSGSQVDAQPGMAPLVLAGPANEVPNRYIVVLKPSRSFSTQDVRAKALQARTMTGATVLYLYGSALDGYAAELAPAALETLRQDPDVAFVQQDQRLAKYGEQISPPWNLDRIDQRSLPVDGLYRYAASGAGVHAYIVDTGINAGHKEFAGRVGEGYDAVDGGAPDDCDGHGTHVAGILGGSTTGVAKGATLHAVRVLDCAGQGTEAGVIAGIDWVTAHHVAPAVANISLGGDPSAALDLALRNSIAAGVVQVVAAGNSGQNACQESPAREPLAITVGAIDDADKPTWFSNFGPCLDLFAPGLNVRSAYTGGADTYATIAGTSMAAPHVAGAAALYLEKAPGAMPAEVANAILGAATGGVVADSGQGSPNLLLYTGSNTEPVPAATPTVAPTVAPTIAPTATATATPAAEVPTATPVAAPPTPTPTATPRPADGLTIDAIEPNAGYDDAPNEVTILGTNFRDGVDGSIGTAPLADVKLISAAELHAVVPAGMAPGVYTLQLQNSGDPEPFRLPDSYTVLHAEGEDFWAAAEDLWTDPLTVRQGQTVQLGLNVHREAGSQAREVEVRFYRQLAAGGDGSQQLPKQLSKQLSNQLVEIGRTTTPPFLPADNVKAVAVAWNTTGLPGTATIVAIVDPEDKLGEAIKSNNRVTRTLNLEPAAVDGTPPVLTALAVNGGAMEAANPLITVSLSAGDAGGPVSSMYLVERKYVHSARQWVAVQNSGWLPFASTHAMTLTPNGGLRYIQAWVSDGAGNISLEAVTANINYNPPSSKVLAGQVRLYRRTLTAGQALNVTLQSAAGDADLYVWAPDGSLAGYSNSMAADSVALTAGEAGDYQIEVYGYQDAAYGVAVEVGDAAAPGAPSPAAISPNKIKRSQPAAALRSGPSVQVAVPPPPGANTKPVQFLPQVYRQ